MSDIYNMKREEYFKPGENVFIHRTKNIKYNGITHNHDFIELTYVASGQAVHAIQGASYAVEKGDIVLVDYGVPHCFTIIPTEEDFVTYDILFTPDFFELSGLENKEFYSLASSHLFSSIFDDTNTMEPVVNIIKTSSKEFCMLFKRIYGEYSKREKGFQNIIRAQLIELIVKIFREIDKQHPEFTQTHQELVDKAIEHMRSNYMSHISLDEIVTNMFVSKNYFRQIFKKTTGTSITSFIQNLRIQEVCRLLEESEGSSADIALQCGFNDMKFFYQTFKKTVGMTPSEYRHKKRR